MPHPDPTISLTEDASPTLQHAVTGETYHSSHGAVQEALHVYIEAGTLWHLCESPKTALRILEIGLGTGLNAVLTFAALAAQDRACHYVALEPFPVSPTCITDYITHLIQAFPDISTPVLNAIHAAAFAIDTTIDGHTFIKHQLLLEAFATALRFDVIYMDAFSPATQPELWDDAMLAKLGNMLAPGGHLVTYCAKGSVRRGLVSAGLEIDRIPGPPGKREMLRARKPFLFSESL